MRLPDRYYFHIGTQALRRQGPGHQITAFQDAANTDMGLDLGDVTQQQNIVPVQNLNNISPKLNFGVRGTIGYLMEDNAAVELSGFYIPRNTSSVDTSNPGQLNAFFVNPPLGFEGDNGLWLQADRIHTELATSIAGAGPSPTSASFNKALRQLH